MIAMSQNHISPAADYPYKTGSQQRCLRDMVALSALPSLWIGLGPAEIAESLTEVLISIFRADLVYVRLKVSETSEVYEGARASGLPKKACSANAVGAVLAPWLDAQPSPSPITISDPLGAGQLRMFTVSIAHDGEYGMACIGSRLAGFPTESDHILCSVACNYAAAALSKYAVVPCPPSQSADMPYRSELRRALEYIHDNLGEDLSLRQIARAACLSTTYVATLFKKAIGQSVHQYVIEKRVERAKALLRQGELSISAIAVEVGFYDSAHMLRHFKRLVGTTPKAFAAKSKERPGTFGYVNETSASASRLCSSIDRATSMPA